MGERASWDRSFVLLAGAGVEMAGFATEQAIAENFSCTERLKFTGIFCWRSTNQQQPVSPRAPQQLTSYRPRLSKKVQATALNDRHSTHPAPLSRLLLAAKLPASK